LVYRSRALAKRSGKPSRSADRQRTAGEHRNDAGPRPAAAIREAPGRPQPLHPGTGASPADLSGPSTKSRLTRAQTAMRTGDFRTARSLAKEVAAQGDEREREQARRILAGLSPDRAAIIAAACVFFVIAVAAILALFRAH
jgi:FimV-like protein